MPSVSSLLNSTALKRVSAVKQLELHVLVSRTFEDFIGAISKFLWCPISERDDGEYDEVPPEDLTDDEEFGGKIERIVMGRRYVNAAILIHVDGKNLLREVRNYKPTSKPALIRREVSDFAADQWLSHHRKSSFDSSAKTRIHAFMELFAQRVMHPSTTTPSGFDRIIQTARAYDTVSPPEPEPEPE